MKITLSREEVKEMVRSHYGINGDFHLEISTEGAKVPSSNTQVVTDSNMFVKEIKSESNFKKAGKLRTKVDYTEYGLKIEEFLKGDDERVEIPLDGAKASTIHSRYKIAAETFGYRHNISLYADKKHNRLFMTKKDW